MMPESLTPGPRPMLVMALAILALTSLVALDGCQTSETVGTWSPEIPIVWDEAELATLNLPLANADASGQHISADYYYRLPVRKIYKSYPIYAPGRGPPGYFDSLLQMEPVEIWDPSTLETQADWERAGEMVFDAPIEFDDTPFAHLPGTVLTAEMVRDPLFYEETETPVTVDGVMPYARYVIRIKGRVEVGGLSCAMCHTRVMADGSIIKGAQGNFPFDRALAFGLRAAGGPTEAAAEAGMQATALLFDAPWVQPPPMAEIGRAIEASGPAAVREAIPAGVIARHGTSLLSPVRVPDLIGVRGRLYLDSTGLQKHRGIADLMRYATLNQDADILTQHDGFRPIELLIPGGTLPDDPATPDEALSRYSEEQLYALALYVYALEPPPNPNLPKTAAEEALVRRGRVVFMEEERCADCHDPGQGYTNNKLVAAPGFDVPADHPAADDIVRFAIGAIRRVNTDPTLTTTTRRGTGLYKVPSLQGVWYRGPLEHNGSVATLEDWFNPARRNDSYVPTGWIGPPGAKTRAVKGHPFGLTLSAEDRRALIALLRTL